MAEPEKQIPLGDQIAAGKAERTWSTWLIMRGRPLAFAVAMLLILIVLLVTGAGDQTPTQ